MAKSFSKAEVEDFFARLKKLDPEPKTELQYVNPYTLLVAVALSAQATDKGVNKATAPLFKAVTTPEQMVALGEEKLTDAIKTIGLYRGKAKNVIALSKILLAQHGGQVPKDRAALEALPGVGRKTANVVLNVAFGEPDHRGGHPYLPRLQPHRSGARQECAGSGAGLGKGGAGHLQEPRPSLADPARALHLRCPQAPVPHLRGARPLPLQRQDEGASGREAEA